MPVPQFIQLLAPDTQALAQEASAGLLRAHAQVSPKFFYDPLGSCLFDAITELDEYYPTRTEAAVLRAHAGSAQGALVRPLLEHLGPGLSMVDLGAGSCAKAAGLFAALQPARYVALDFSVEYLRAALTRLQLQHPAVAMTGVGLDFSATLQLPAGVVPGPALVFYPGSSIGNFRPDDALVLLRQAHTLSAGGALMIGVDLVKPTPVLEAAYDDALGVTADFNQTLLRHLNRWLGSNFDTRQWQHVAFFDAQHSRIEMHLESRVAQTVRWPGGERRFLAGERIHTENSYKWQPASFEALLRDAGFVRVQTHTDAQGWFAVVTAFAR
jgi:dimethylhistidine N-methyltransferase